MITLLPTNKRLKQLIKQHGNQWHQIKQKPVQCFNDIGILITSKDKSHTRWIKPQDKL